MRIPIKALSVNEAWQGRRYKTKKYKAYERDVLLLLRPLKVPGVDLELILEIGFSNRMSDVDNVVKPFLDILQKKYDFNDSRVYRIVMDKVIVKKGNEYIRFELNELDRGK